MTSFEMFLIQFSTFDYHCITSFYVYTSYFKTLSNIYKNSKYSKEVSKITIIQYVHPYFDLSLSSQDNLGLVITAILLLASCFEVSRFSFCWISSMALSDLKLKGNEKAFLIVVFHPLSTINSLL